MELTYIILLILLLIYIPLYIHVRMRKGAKDSKIVAYGPFIMLKTSRGIELLDGIAKYKRFWAAFGVISKIMAFFLMAMIMFILILDLVLLPTALSSPGIGVEYALAIPGLNPMLPLIYGLIGLIVAMVVHEMAHGIQTRANDMKVESVGILYGVVPVGAFVEPNEEQIKECGRRPRSTMFAAGIAINLTMAIVVFLLMSIGMMGSLSSPHGDRAAVVNVIAGSPADDMGITYSSIILNIDSSPVATYDDLMDHSFTLDGTYSIDYLTSDGPRNASIYMGAYVDGIAKGSPAEKAGIQKSSFLVNIERISDGTSYPISNIREFQWLMDVKNPDRLRSGEEVDVTYVPYTGGTLGTPDTKTVTLGSNGDRAFLGVTYSLSGFSFTTPNEILSVAKNPLHNSASVSDAAYDALSYIGAPFRGYSPIPQDLQWWYQSGVMSDDIFWVVVHTLFWIFWLNLVFAVTNALPAVPFDGGYLFMDGVGAIVDRTHKDATPERREKITNSITSVVSYGMLLILLLVMVALLI